MAMALARWRVRPGPTRGGNARLQDAPRGRAGARLALGSIGFGLVLVMAGCGGDRATRVVAADGSMVIGRLVEQRPDAVVLEIEGGRRVTIPRNDIVSMDAPPATEIAALPATSPDGTPRDPFSEPAGHGASAIPEDGHSGRQPPSGRATGRDSRPNPAVGPGTARGGSERARRSESVVLIPEGTVLAAVLETAIASDSSRASEAVRAALQQPAIIDGVEAVPAGARLEGSIVEAVGARTAGGRGRILVRFDLLVIGGEKIPIEAPALRFVAPVLTPDDARKVGVGAAIGGFIGRAVSKTKRGLGIGSAAGAGGTAVAVTYRNEMRLPAGTALQVRLGRALSVPPR